jgi:DNA-binding NarL/FixJ family response regulator
MKTRPTKRDPAYWRERLFRNVFSYKGRRVEVRSWSVKMQLFGKRKAFSLGSSNRSRAAQEASRIYQTIAEQGWEAIAKNGTGTGRRFRVAPGSQISPASIERDVEYWKGRLIHRRYPEPPPSQPAREFSIRIEHERTSHYFPLGTGDENAAAGRAMQIYRTVVNEGWAAACASHPRELSVALRWQDNPLAWTYTTIHTRLNSGPRKPPASGLSGEHSVGLIEPDAGIRFALAAHANAQAGFRCDASFASAAEALREIPRRQVALVLVNHDLPEASALARLDELQRRRPDLTVLSYSVFEDADLLFKSTPGGSVVYMLKRTAASRLFEPIADLAEAPIRERVAAHVWKYFQQLSALLPSGPPVWKIAKLTPREHEILASLSKGDLVKEIAHKLGISAWTVQGHVKSIFEKLKVHTRTEAVIKYLQK